MAAGLQDTALGDVGDVGEIVAFVAGLSQEGAEAVRRKAGPFLAYVRSLQEEEAVLLGRIVEHAAEVRLLSR